MTCDPHWTHYFTAFLTPTVAGLGIYIACRQLRTARNKLKLDLFDRRLSIYQAACDFLGSINTSDRARHEEMSIFLRATREARWLLGIDVANYLDKDLYLAASRFQALQSEFENVPAGEMRKPMAERKAEMRTWFLEQTTVLDKMFSPFLNLEH